MIENTLHTEKSDIEGEAINVILAEDDADDVLIFKIALKEINVAVNLKHVNNGDKLLALLKELLPDILFIDIDMPCKNGVTCIAEIRKNRVFDSLPIILFSGHTFQKYIEDAFSYGANFYLVKANSVAQLSESLKRIFSIDWKKTMYYPPKHEFVINYTSGII